MHRPRPAGDQHREGAVDDERQVFRIEQRVRIERQRLHHAVLVGQLMQEPATVTERIAAIDAGDHQHRDGILPGLRHRRDGVCEPRTGDDEGDTRLAADPGISIGHEARTLFMARGHMADLRCRQPAIKLDRVHPGDAENHLDAIGLEQIDQDFSNCFFRPHAQRSLRRLGRSASAAMRRQASSMSRSGTVRLTRR
ncbi:hypothetical protein D9M72_445080 [compost metagenome]